MTRHASTYSWRGKLGLIVPPTNTVNEAEWGLMLPEGITHHAHRMALHSDTTSEAGRASLEADLDDAIGMLAQSGADAVAYACTAGSMVTPANGLPDALTARNGVPCLTTAAAIIAALKALGVKRLSVATPYHQALNDHEVHFLADHGVEVLRILGLGIGAGGPQEYPRIARTPLEKVAAHARAAHVPGADALLITCTDFPTLPLIEPLEKELGIPVITSNQATLWAMLRTIGVQDAPAAGGVLFRS